MRAKLEEFQAEFPFIGEVRGMGLMQSMEIVTPNTIEPDAARTLAIMNAAKERGLLLGKGGLYNNVIRITPHLNVSAGDVDIAMNLLANALADVV